MASTRGTVKSVGTPAVRLFPRPPLLVEFNVRPTGRRFGIGSRRLLGVDVENVAKVKAEARGHQIPSLPNCSSHHRCEE